MKIQELLDLIEASGIKPCEDISFKFKSSRGEEYDIVIDCITTETSAHGITPIKLNTIVMLEIF